MQLNNEHYAVIQRNLALFNYLSPDSVSPDGEWTSEVATAFRNYCTAESELNGYQIKDQPEYASDVPMLLLYEDPLGKESKEAEEAARKKAAAEAEEEKQAAANKLVEAEARKNAEENAAQRAQIFANRENELEKGSSNDETLDGKAPSDGTNVQTLEGPTDTPVSESSVEEIGDSLRESQTNFEANAAIDTESDEKQ